MPSLKPNGKRLNGKRSGSWITKTRRLAIYLRDGFRCQYCGCDLAHEDPRSITLDHLKPRVKGGGNESKNLVTACTTCNFTRQHTPWRTFAPGGAVERILRTVRRIPNIKLAKALIAGHIDRNVAILEACR